MEKNPAAEDRHVAAAFVLAKPKSVLLKQNFMMVLRPYMPNFSICSLIVVTSVTGGAE